MKQSLSIHITMLSLLGLLLMGCTERIDIELDSTYTRLVVFGEITNELKHHVVTLSTSSDYFSNQSAPYVSGATIKILSDSGVIRCIEDANNPGTYVSEIAFSGSTGDTYELQISDVDVDEDNTPETYRAVSTMPAIGTLDSILMSYFESPFVTGYQISMYAQDPPTQEWYSFKMHKNGKLLTDTLVKFSVQPDIFFNGEYIYGFPVAFLSDDDSLEAAKPGDIITFELNSITQDYYDFIVSAQSEIFGSNPLFGGPPANVTTNIQDEGVGIFTATSITRLTDTIPGL